MHKTTRRIHYILGAAATLALTQCASVQEIEAPVLAPATFEVFATPVDTKTVNDRMSTLWESGDRFSLFHAPAGTAKYTADGAFAVDEPATGHARGNVSGTLEGSYDWFLVYPHAASATTPSAVPVLIGAAADGVQTQNGASSGAHLAGESIPVAGRASGIAGTEVPVLHSAPIVSVIAVKVTNPGAASATVTSVRFKAPEAIVGNFTVDVTGDNPVFEAVSASDEAVLSVSGGALLVAGESAVFYLGIKPFTAPEGSTLVLTVNDQERSVTLPSAVTFSPGKIKTLSMTLDESEPPVVKPYYFRKATTVVSGHKYILVAPDTKADNVFRMAHALSAGTDSGRLEAEDVTEEDEVITIYGLENVFTFFDTDNGWTIRQSDGRYLYNNSADNLYAGTEANAGFYWTITFGDEGYADILNRSRHIQYNPTSSVRKFQSRQTSSSVGANPWLYELQNDDEAAAELLEKTVPGVYDYNATNWLYEDGTHQTSVRVGGSVLAFRLYEPAEYSVVQVTGIPAGLAEGDRFPVRLVRYVKQVSADSADLSVTVLKVEDGKAWLAADGGTGLIVNIE